MEIYYKTKQIQKLCCDEAMMRRRLGAVMARKLKQRLMELSAVASLSDISYLPPARCHLLKGSGMIFSVDLEHPYRLLFTPQGPISKTENGEIDRTRIKGIIIIAIVDTHH